MFLFKPDRTLAAGCALLVPLIAAAPALAVEPAPLEDAVLRQSTTRQDQDADQSAPPERSAKPAERNTRRGELSQIVRPTETELRTTAPELPIALNLRPASDGLPHLDTPGTNLVFAAGTAGH